MKNLYYFTTALVLTLIAISCKKQDALLKSKELTTCPPNATCSYLFSEGSDIENFQLKTGNYRLFWNTLNYNEIGSVSTLWIKAPIKGDTFSLSTKDIAKGLVQYSQSCDLCLLIGLKPVGGYVKGKNVSPEKSADQTKWLIEAEIVLAEIHTNKPKDTLHLKQYFSPNFISN